MNQFPTSPIPVYPLDITGEWKTLSTDFESGRQQRRQVWTFPRRSIKLEFDAITQVQADTLWNFYNTCKGAYDPFWFFDPTKDSSGNWHSYTGEYVGRGDGVTTIFELPSKSTTALTVYVNGTSTSVTFNSGVGDAGVDDIQFSSAPAAGSTITADFTGQIRYRVRFAEDKLSKSLFIFMLYKIGINLQEVRV